MRADESPGLRCKPLARVLASGLLAGLVMSCASNGAKPVDGNVGNGAKAIGSSISQRASSWRSRQGLYFKRNWGVELIDVHPVSSGYMLAFRYRILDADKAKVLNDRHTKAYLVDDATGIVLAVPALENIGELRPGSTPQPGRTYFMVFGNPGKVVKVGNLVTLVAGNFRADGIVVE